MDNKINAIVKTTSKGQITLPVAWRRKFSTNQFLVSFSGDVAEIRPIDLVKISKKEKNEKIIFNSLRDNRGEGIDARDLLKILRKIDGQD